MTDVYIPERSDLNWIVLNPFTGREQGGARPALVFSTHAFNSLTLYALVAPITRTIRGGPFKVVIPQGLCVSGAVLYDHGRGVDFDARHTRFLGKEPRRLANDVLERVGAILET